MQELDQRLFDAVYDNDIDMVKKYIADGAVE